MERKFLDTILDENKMVLDPLHETVRENMKQIKLRDYGKDVDINDSAIQEAIGGIKSIVINLLQQQKKSKKEIDNFVSIIDKQMSVVSENEKKMLNTIREFKQSNPDYNTDISVLDFLNDKETPEEILDAHEEHLACLNNVIRILLNPEANGEPVGDEFFASLNPIIQEVE